MGSAKPDSLRTIPSASGGIARLACARLRELGKDVTDILSRAGVSVEQIDDPTIRLEMRAQIKLLDLVAEELQDELLGFHLARGFDLRRVGLVYYVMASSEHLADALRNCERYSKINSEGVRLRFSLDRRAAIALDYVNIDRCQDRHHLEFWLVTLVRICRQVTATRLAPLHLKVRHFRGDPPAEFKSFFGADVEFGAGADEIAFPARTASLPVVGRDIYLNKLLRRYAEEALARRLRGRASVRSQVERILPQLLPHGATRASQVARHLGMSSRTLSRKLSDEGVTFAEILDELRAALAKRYLSERELPISEIAWLLGYREVSSMTHAFKRWTGVTPRQHRSSERLRTGRTDGPATAKTSGRERQP